MNRQMRWDDLRVILAVTLAGTLSGAGRKLGVSHATVFRRLGEIEDRLGVKLFDRSRTGYSPTLAGEETATVAQRIESEVLKIERHVIGQDLRPSGTVRVTTTDTLLFGLLSPIFAKFRKSYCEINLEITVSNERFNLSKREADVAIRPTIVPPDQHLVGRKLGVIAQAIYGHTDLIAQGQDEFDLHSMAWIGPDESMAYHALDRWMTGQGIVEPISYRLNTVLGMLAAARDGAGLAVLPCYLGDRESGLMRLGETIPALSTDLWLLTHPDMRKTARIRALLDFIAERIKEYRPHIEGVR